MVARSALLMGALLSASTLPSSNLCAQTNYNWSGDGTTNNWSQSQNWGGQTPASGVNTVINFPNIRTGQSVNDLGGARFDLNKLSFTFDYQFGNRPSLALSGTDLGFQTSSLNVAPTIEYATLASVSVSNRILLLGSPLTISANNTNLNAFLSFTGGVTGTGDITKTGTGRVALDFGAGVNTFTGTVRIQGGELFMSTDAGLGNSSNVVRFTGGTLAISTLSGVPFTSNRPILIDSAEGIVRRYGAGETRLNGLISGNALQLSGTGNLFTLTNANTYTGGTTLRNAVVAVADSANLGTGAVATATGTTGTVQLLASLSLQQGLTTANNSTLTVNTNGFNLTSTGLLSGSGGYVKAGSGTWSLAGAVANNNTGLMSVQAGTLALNKSPDQQALGGNLEVNGGVVRLDAPNQLAIGGTVTLRSGTFTTARGADGVGMRVNTGALTLNGTSNLILGTGSHEVRFNGIGANPFGTLRISGWSGNPGQLGIAGELAFGNLGSTPNLTYSAFLGQVQFDGYLPGQATFIPVGLNTHQLVPVPEPSLILAVGVVGLTLSRAVRKCANRKRNENR